MGRIEQTIPGDHTGSPGANNHTHNQTIMAMNIKPLDGMPEGTYYKRRNGELKFWRNLQLRFIFRTMNPRKTRKF